MARSPMSLQRYPHRRVFVRGWLRDLFRVASVAPSSRWLAKLMAGDIESGACVVELGAGTGTLTTAILDRGIHAPEASGTAPSVHLSRPASSRLTPPSGARVACKLARHRSHESAARVRQRVRALLSASRPAAPSSEP